MAHNRLFDRQANLAEAIGDYPRPIEQWHAIKEHFYGEPIRHSTGKTKEPYGQYPLAPRHVLQTPEQTE